MNFDNYTLGRLIPKDLDHAAKSPFSALNIPVVANVETIINTPKWVPIKHNQGKEGACLKKGTLITMYDGKVKPIEDIKTFDRVLSAEGYETFVTETMGRIYKGNVVKISLYGHKTLELTDNHPVLTDKGYIPSCNIKKGDYVAVSNKKCILNESNLITYKEVIDLDNEEYEGIVFNFSTHKYESYVAEGIGVHNCVAFSTSLMMAILNEHQAIKNGNVEPYIHYNPWWLWDKSKEVDEWESTNPGDNNGTSVKAASIILSTIGHVNWTNEEDPKAYDEPSIDNGISVARWASSVDEIRTTINDNIPVAIGVNWYKNFDRPIKRKGEWWIGRGNALGYARGGHSVCIIGASDNRQAFLIQNSWGEEYPQVWMPYETIGKLITENGEFLLASDR